MKIISFFQVIFEGEIGKGNLGGIAVDDISINNHISQEDCASKDGFGVGMNPCQDSLHGMESALSFRPEVKCRQGIKWASLSPLTSSSNPVT